MRIVPGSGRALPDEQVSRLSERAVRAGLPIEDHSLVHDVDGSDGLWTPGPDNPTGVSVRLQVASVRIG